MGTKLSTDGFFWMREGVLSPEFCSHLIDKFESCPDIHNGVTLKGYKPEMKRSTDLLLSVHPDFKEEDNTIFIALSMNARDYVEQLPYKPWKENVRDTGYNMQRTKPGEEFIWHTDFAADVQKNQIRICTYILYLNDIEKGGETEFANGLIIKPKTGRLLMFPSDYSVMHRGVSPVDQTKYIVTGWFCQAIMDD